MSQQWNIEVINAVRDGVKVGINAKDGDGNIEIQGIASSIQDMQIWLILHSNKFWDFTW